jgi:hypothetical protein
MTIGCSQKFQKNTESRSLRWVSQAIVWLGLAVIGFRMPALAQSEDNIWITPVNLSQSGSASDPVIVPLPDGTLRVLWWDQFDGTMVADEVLGAATADETGEGESTVSPMTPTLTTRAWSAPKMATIRIPTTVIRENQRVTILAPIQTAPKIVGDTSGRAHAFWLAEPDEETGRTALFYSRLEPGTTSWSTPSSLTSSSASFAVTADVSGTVHLVYVKPEPDQERPVGLYYRQLPLGGASWSALSAVEDSRYLRLLPAEDDLLRLTADKSGSLFATWDDPQQGQVLLALSADGGATWSDPEPYLGPGVQPEKDRVIALPGSAPAVLWASASDPKARIVASSAGNTLKLAAWDGESWLATQHPLLRFQDPELAGQVRLNALSLLVVSPSSSDQNPVETLVVIGTDDNRDLWITGSKVDALEQLLAAQSVVDSPETEASETLNLSKSGAASQPVIVTRPDGSLTSFWWDKYDGLTVADGTLVASSVLSGAEEVPIVRDIWGEPRSVPLLVPETVMEEGEEVLVYTVVEAMPRIVADAIGRIHAFWLEESAENTLADETTVPGPLVHSQLEADETAWSLPTTLCNSAASFDVATDATGTLHLACIQPLHSPYSPSGVYYRRLERDGSGWTDALPLQQSLYFRSLSPETAHLRLNADEAGAVNVTWDDPHQARLMLAHSPDGGTTWQGPIDVYSHEGRSQRGRFVRAPGGETLMLWEDQDPGGPCTMVQAPVSDVLDGIADTRRLVLKDLEVCPEGERFMPLKEGQNLMVAGSGSRDLTLAVWDGSAAAETGEGQWSEPIRLGFSFEDPTRERQVYLSDLYAAIVELPLDTLEGLAGTALLVVGTDQDGDVWATSSESGALEIIFASPAAWSPPESIPQSETHTGLPAIALDTELRLHVLWRERTDTEDSGNDLIYAGWDGDRWTRPAPVLYSPEGRAGEPVMVTLGELLHVVWSSQGGEILYSNALAQEAYTAAGWSAPSLLSEEGTTANRVDIAGDTGENLHVVYAVPVNERRGIYYTNSIDGETWAPPRLAFDAASAGWTAVSQPRLTVDTHGFVHVVWVRTTLPGSGRPEGVYYAHSLDGGASWSEPLVVAEGPFDWPQIGTAGSGQIHLVWHGVNGQGAWWHRFSSDAGQTWTDQARLPDFGNVAAPARLLAVDSGALHLVGLHQGGQEFSLLEHAIWNGAAWTKSEGFPLEVMEVESGVSAAIDPGHGHMQVILGGESQGEEEAQVVLWHTGRQVPTVGIALTTDFVPQLTATPTAKPLPTDAPRPTLSLDGSSATTGGDMSFLLPLLLAGAGVLLLVAAVLGTRFLLAGRR